MKIITVGNGYIANHLPYQIANYRLGHDQKYWDLFFDTYHPDVVVNCTGFCGSPNIDQCQSEKSKTYTANVIIPSILAKECERRNIRLLHIGSGCIYFGESPNFHYIQNDENITPLNKIEVGWKETDPTFPKSYYSKTKYACDLILGEMSNVTTLRIRMPISSKNNPRNFINKIRGYKQIIDIPNSVTFISDLVRCVDWAIKENKNGIWHVTNPEPLSAADVMREYQKYDSGHTFDIIDEAELDKITKAKRSNCILNTEKLNSAGFFMTPSKEALEKCMKEYIENF